MKKMKFNKKPRILIHNGEKYQYVTERLSPREAWQLSNRIKKDEGCRIRIRFMDNKFMIFKGEKKKMWRGIRR